MRIVILGAGYVGLVSAACFAAFGVQVTVVDPDAARVTALKAGKIPIYEPELDALVAQNVAAGRLYFQTALDDLTDVAAVFIAVGTPSRRGDGHADLAYVYAAAEQIARALPTGQFTVVVTKSTVPVGTGREVMRRMHAANPDADFAVCSNPEFLREGSAINDFMRPDRVVIGADDVRALTILRTLYRPLYLLETPMVETSLETAELTKYASNAFLATKIAFINEMADLCEATGADVRVVAKAMGLDGRIGRKFLHAGPGFGGSCFPKDTLALARTAAESKVPLPIVESVIASNRQRKQRMAGRIIAACGGSVAGLTIAILGVTFKPNTDDIRESPALDIVPALQAAGARVRAYDPVGKQAAQAQLPDVVWAEDAYAAAQGAAALVILTEWNEFRALDLARLKTRLSVPRLIDLRNIYKPEEATAQGFTYHGVGTGQPTV